MAPWVKGLISAVVSGSATAISLYFADLLNDQAIRNWDKFLLVVLIGGIVGLANYLKQSPIPKDE